MACAQDVNSSLVGEKAVGGGNEREEMLSRPSICRLSFACAH